MNFSHFINRILPEASAFLGVFFVVMMLGYGVLYFIDFVPEAPKDSTTVEEPASKVNPIQEAQTEPEPIEATSWGDPMPISISIPALDKTITVLNPNSRSVAELDKALLNGVVRHPDSADLNDDKGNMLVLGHSSYLKNVFNKNFQAFNGIQNLTWGDTITVRSSDTEYTYRVERVYQAKASAVSIPTKGENAKLTLATCDTFGAKEDRFIVESILVSKKAL